MDDWIFYHVYPLGACGAEPENDFTGETRHRLGRLEASIAAATSIGCNALLLGPLFESGSHGYDTKDFHRVDRRLGDGADLGLFCKKAHDAGLKIVFDAVFNHVGREFFAFSDLREKASRSPYAQWFSGLDFSRGNSLGDGFCYDCWEGHLGLARLNQDLGEVRDYLYGVIDEWRELYQVDGLRLDAAERLSPGFIRDLSSRRDSRWPGLWLMGEAIHGDYRRLAGPGLLDAVTNYEAYKGLWSSHNDANYFEIAYSLKRQFGEDGIYRGVQTYNFADNHDVNRLASVLGDPADLYPLSVLLYCMPGLPSIYYGSETGVAGTKAPGSDAPLRPSLEGARGPHADLAPILARLAAIRQASPAIRRGEYRELSVTHRQLAFLRRGDGDQAIIAVNSASFAQSLRINLAGECEGVWTDLLNPGTSYRVNQGRLEIRLHPKWGAILRRAASPHTNISPGA